MNRALVTGAAGMLGSYIAARLLEEGWTVRGLARTPLAMNQLSQHGIEPVPGDLLNADSLATAAHGCDAIIHAAAAIGSDGDADTFERTNVAGTGHVVDAAARAGARVVHVSSTAVFGSARYGTRPTDEDVPLPELDRSDVYGRSKQDAERVVLKAQRAGLVWAAIVRPPMMYGRHDRQFVPRVAPVLRARCFPLIGGGRTTLPLVHADAVADGAVRVLLNDRADGRIYHLTTDYPLSAADLIRFAAEGLGRPVWTPRIPTSVGRGGFAALGAALRLGGRADLARHAPGTLEMLLRDNPFDSERARRDIGWSPRIPPSEGIPDAFRWWRDRRHEATQGGGAR